MFDRGVKCSQRGHSQSFATSIPTVGGPFCSILLNFTARDWPEPDSSYGGSERSAYDRFRGPSDRTEVYGAATYALGCHR
jgi:hypothetical protein